MLLQCPGQPPPLHEVAQQSDVAFEAQFVLQLHLQAVEAGLVHVQEQELFRPKGADLPTEFRAD